MYRSLLLVSVFLFFSVALPCVCAGETVALVMEGSCAMIASSHAHDGNDSGTMTMNFFDHIASWRAFLSSSLPAVFFFVALALLSVFGQKEWFVRFARIVLPRRGIFHPPEYFDERVLLSGPIFRALFSGVLHAKVA